MVNCVSSIRVSGSDLCFSPLFSYGLKGGRVGMILLFCSLEIWKAQMVKCFQWEQGVVGSNPCSRTLTSSLSDHPTGCPSRVSAWTCALQGNPFTASCILASYLCNFLGCKGKKVSRENWGRVDKDKYHKALVAFMQSTIEVKKISTGSIYTIRSIWEKAGLSTFRVKSPIYCK